MRYHVQIILGLCLSVSIVLAKPAERGASDHESTLANSQVTRSHKAEIKAAMQSALREGKQSPEVDSAVEAFLADKTKPESDRYEIRAMSHQFELSRSAKASKEARIEDRARLARQLITEFPNDPRGHAYFLQLASAQSGPKGRQMAEEVMRSSAPDNAKQVAARLIAQRDSVGKALKVPGLDLAPHKGKPVVIYTWSIDRIANLEAVKHWAKIPGLGFVAINMDADSERAKSRAEELQVPGERLYEPNGVDGPLAAALNFTSRTSVYIVDASGVLIDVSAHENTREKLKSVLAVKEGAK